jgi:two-component system, OmpR family, sensor histidine kinase BaeS
MVEGLSFRARLAMAFVGVGLVAAATAAVLVNVEFGRRFDSYVSQRQDDRQRSVITALASTYARAGSWTSAELVSSGAVVAMEGGTLEILDAAGRTIWTATDRTTGVDAAAHRSMMGTTVLGPTERLPIVVGGETVGYGVVRFPAAGRLAYDESFRDSVNRLLVAGGIGAALIALGLGTAVARRTVRPVRALTDAAVRYTLGDRAARVDVEGRDEFSEMGRAFNAMAEEVAEEDRQRRAFADDVAHELRTPLAIMTSQLEAMRDGAISIDEASLASLQDEVLRTSRLVKDLEAMAAARATRFTIRPFAFDLGDEVDALVTAERARAAERGITLTADVQHVVVRGDRVRIRQAIGNVLANSFKFTPPGGEVDVRVGVDRNHATVRIADTGIGIPPSDLDDVFERAYRGRAAPGDGASGSGIGLAVVREIMTAHGGKASAHSVEGHGTTLVLRFPVPSDTTAAAPTP